jgi:hypothetical protein
VTTGCPAVADPYATVGAYSGGTYTPTFTPPTKATTCTQLNYSIKKATVTLSPGRYCGGMNLQAQANVTLQPGIYYIDNGALNVQAGASLSGSNVLIYLEGASASATLIGGGTVNLSGRTVGNSYAGFLMIAAPNVTANTTIQGGGVFKMEGTVYVPKSRIELGGNGDINNPGVAVAGMVAKDFYLRGNGTFNYKRRTGAAATSGQVPDIMPFKPVLTTTTVTTSTQSTTRKTVLSD